MSYNTSEMMEILRNPSKNNLQFQPMLNTTGETDEKYLQDLTNGLLVSQGSNDGINNHDLGDWLRSHWDDYEEPEEPNFIEKLGTWPDYYAMKLFARAPEGFLNAGESMMDMATSLSDDLTFTPDDSDKFGLTRFDKKLPIESLDYVNLKLSGDEWAEMSEDEHGSFNEGFLDWIEGKISSDFKGMLQYRMNSAKKGFRSGVKVREDILTRLEEARSKNDTLNIKRYENYLEFMEGNLAIGDGFGLEEDSPLALFADKRMHYKFKFDSWRNWVAKVWGDKMVDEYEARPEFQSFVQWYNQTSPSDIVNNSSWVVRTGAYMTQIMSGMGYAAITGIGTYWATKNPKAAMNAAMATMYVLEHTDEYEQGVKHWESKGFARDDARAMSANTAVAYGVGSAWIERFGTWGIYANRLGPSNVISIKRNIFGRTVDKIEKAIDEKILGLRHGLINRTGARNVLNPSISRQFTAGALRQLPIAVMESTQEVLQLTYQKMLQTGYTDKDFLDTFNEGELKDSGIGGFIGGLLFGPLFSYAGNTINKSQQSYNTVVNKATEVKPGEDVEDTSKKTFAKWIGDRIWGKDETEAVIPNEITGETDTYDVGVDEIKSYNDLAAALEIQYIQEDSFYPRYHATHISKKNSKDWTPIDRIINQDKGSDSDFALKLYHIYQATGDMSFLSGVKDSSIKNKFKKMIAFKILEDKSVQINKEWVGRQKRNTVDVDNAMNHIKQDSEGLIKAAVEGNIDEFIDSKLEELGEEKFIKKQSASREASLKKYYNKQDVTMDVDEALKKQQEKALEGAEEKINKEFGPNTQVANDIGSNTQAAISKLKNTPPQNRAAAVMNLGISDTHTLAKSLGIVIPETESGTPVTDLKSMNALKQEILNRLTTPESTTIDVKEKEEPSAIEKSTKEAVKPKKTVKEKLLEEGEKREAEVTEAEDTRKPEDVFDVFDKDTGEVTEQKLEETLKEFEDLDIDFSEHLGDEISEINVEDNISKEDQKEINEGIEKDKDELNDKLCN